MPAFGDSGRGGATVWGSTYLAITKLLPPGRLLLAGTPRALPDGPLLVVVTRTVPEAMVGARRPAPAADDLNSAERGTAGASPHASALPGGVTGARVWPGQCPAGDWAREQSQALADLVRVPSHVRDRALGEHGASTFRNRYPPLVTAP